MPHETIHYQSLVHLLCCDWLSVLSMQSLDSCGFPFQLHFQDLVWCSSLSFSTKPWILLWLWLRHPFHHKSDSFVCLFLLVQGICFGLGIHLTVFYFWQSLMFIFFFFLSVPVLLLFSVLRLNYLLIHWVSFFIS